MRIVYHLGTHCTDEERLLRCLLKNRGVLATEGIVVPGPARYRTLLRDTAMTLKGQPPQLTRKRWCLTRSCQSPMPTG